MAKEMNLATISGYLFILGLIIAVVAGIIVNEMSVSVTTQAWISIVFIAIGLVLGWCMSTSKKVEEEIYILLMVTVALLLANNMGIFQSLDVLGAKLGHVINAIVNYIAFFSAAAIIVLAIRTIFRFHVGKIS
jgi:hypothetical protein